MSATNKKHVEIAGAGFAGLTVGAALAKFGWSVRIHERGNQLREQGAGILLWQNALKVIGALGYRDLLATNSMRPDNYETRMNNKTVSIENLEGIDWVTLTRPFLHSVLLQAARESGVEVVTNSEVVQAKEDGTVILADGTELKADLVIGADGVGSKVRDSLGIEYERNHSSDGISRFLVNRRKADLAAMDPTINWDNMIDFWNLEPRTLRVLYTPANEKDLYLALMAPVSDQQGTKVPIDLDLWTEIHPHLAPVLEEVANTEGKYFHYQTNNLAQWTKGRVVLIGDSAHAMCPALAQGAGSAMTNAYTLASAVSKCPLSEIPDALQQWEAIERPYTERVQAKSKNYADTRGMSQGNQFTGDTLEMMLYDPTDENRHSVKKTVEL